MSQIAMLSSLFFGREVVGAKGRRKVGSPGRLGKLGKPQLMLGVGGKSARQWWSRWWYR